MNAAWSFLSSLALKLIGPILAYLKGRGDVELKHKDEELRDAKNSESAWANRPKSDSDALDRLSRASERAKKS